MASSKKLSLKLLVDKREKRVICAESDKDFIDILFSFLTMPIGRIIRILGKESSLGYIDKLYESIEILNGSYFNTEACKKMLLDPLNAYQAYNDDLVIRIDESDPPNSYTCRKLDCAVNRFPVFSSLPNARCGCGEIMDYARNWGEDRRNGPDGDGVYVKGLINFIITDDLNIMPASTKAIYKVFEKLGIKDWGDIEETIVDLDADMLRDLLKRSLLSKSPLSGMYFQDSNMINAKFLSKFRALPKIEEDSAIESKKLKAKLLLCKSNYKAVYAETGEGFLDLLVSFLTFPLGSIVKLLDKCSSIGCLDNLYRSVETLSSDINCIKSDDCKLMLLDPQLAPHFGCSNSPLPYIEMLPGAGNLPHCSSCFNKNTGITGRGYCMHGNKYVTLAEMNPKLFPASKEVGGGYTKKEVKFMITNELEVTPFSSLGSIQAAQKQNVAIFGLEEKEIDIGEYEALNLLKACLTSQDPLSEAFMPNHERRSMGENLH